MDSLTFLERIAKAKVQPLYVLHGDEDFLKRLVLVALRPLVLGPDDDGFALSTYPGDKATWAQVHDELQTLPFLAPRRLVVVEEADPFVSRERTRLEKFVQELPGKGKITGVLVLDVNTWASTTRLAKMLPEPSLITCKAPASHHLPQWCVTWCAARHQKQLAATAARLLVELVGPQMGLLDQELNKLALYAGDAPRIEQGDVDALVGQSRAEKTWEIFDLIGAGKPGDALAFLERLFDQGEEPMKLLGAFSMQLRRLGQAGRLVTQGVSLNEALERTGVPPFARRSAEAQMRHLGKRRLDLLYTWLLETDLAMKSTGHLSPRLLMERLVVRLARTRG